jgi:hypothetical protein
VVAIPPQHSTDFAGTRRPALRGRSAENGPFQDALDLRVVEIGMRREQQRLGEVEVDAQRMRHVGFLGGQRGDDMEQILEGTAEPTPFSRDAQQAQPGLTKQRETVVRQFASRLTRGAVLADRGGQRRQRG